MNHFDHDYYYDGEWDETGELSWNEFDWQKYLKRTTHELVRFLVIYNNLKEQDHRLDKTAHLMGWDTEGEWEVPEQFPSSDDIEGFLSQAVEHGAEDITRRPEELEPYTLHRHPVFVATRALYLDINHHWEQYLNEAPEQISAQFTWRFARSLQQGEVNAILAVQSIDLGDYALALCHYKRAMSSLNYTLNLIQKLSSSPFDNNLSDFQRDITQRLFDIRESWLRSMAECREEAENNPS